MTLTGRLYRYTLYVKIREEIMKKLTALISGFIIIPIIAGAGGMERTALPTAFMFEEGGYGEITFSNRDYDVTDNMFAPTNSMYGDVSGVSFSGKFDTKTCKKSPATLIFLHPTTAFLRVSG